MQASQQLVSWRADPCLYQEELSVSHLYGSLTPGWAQPPNLEDLSCAQCREPHGDKQTAGLFVSHPPGDPHLIYVYIHKCISSGKELLEAFHTSVCSEGHGASPVLTLQAVLTSPRLGEADQMPPLEHISQLYCCLEFLMIFANSI